KYLRYNLEFMGGLLGAESDAIIALLRKLQDDLGDLNDAVVSKQLLSAGDNNDEATVSRYERDQEKIIEKLRSQMNGDFARFVEESNRNRLLAAIARI
ncbi:MAG: CHAD domain-containing protein, partial [Caldilinea sp.]